MSALCCRGAWESLSGVIVEFSYTDTASQDFVIPQVPFPFHLDLAISGLPTEIKISIGNGQKTNLPSRYLHLLLLGMQRVEVVSETQHLILSGYCGQEWLSYSSPKLDFKPIWQFYSPVRRPVKQTSMAVGSLWQHASAHLPCAEGRSAFVSSTHPWTSKAGSSVEFKQVAAGVSQGNVSWYPNQARGMSVVCHNVRDDNFPPYMMTFMSLLPPPMVNAYIRVSAFEQHTDVGFYHLYVRAFNQRPHIVFPSSQGLGDSGYFKLGYLTKEACMNYAFRLGRNDCESSAEDALGAVTTSNVGPSDYSFGPPFDRALIMAYACFQMGQINPVNTLVVRSGCPCLVDELSWWDVMLTGGLDVKLFKGSSLSIPTHMLQSCFVSPFLPDHLHDVYDHLSLDQKRWWSRLSKTGVSLWGGQSITARLSQTAAVVKIGGTCHSGRFPLHYVAGGPNLSCERPNLVPMLLPMGADWYLDGQRQLHATVDVIEGVVRLAIYCNYMLNAMGDKEDSPLPKDKWQFSKRLDVAPVRSSLTFIPDVPSSATEISYTEVASGLRAYAVPPENVDIPRRDAVNGFRVFVGQLPPQKAVAVNVVVFLLRLADAKGYLTGSQCMAGRGAIIVQFDSQSELNKFVRLSDKYLWRRPCLWHAPCQSLIPELQKMASIVDASEPIHPIHMEPAKNSDADFSDLGSGRSVCSTADDDDASSGISALRAIDDPILSPTERYSSCWIPAYTNPKPAELAQRAIKRSVMSPTETGFSDSPSSQQF